MPTTPPDPTDKKFMTLALDACRRGIQVGQSPFGACIVRNDQVIAATHNHVWLQIDPTAHAEVHCIRTACRDLKSIHLQGCTIYSTTEPCPMCFSAIHWARIDRIVYAARVADAAHFGFNELQITNAQMKQTSNCTIELISDFLRDEAIAIYHEWQNAGGRVY